jgi:hypothetical protein
MTNSLNQLLNSWLNETKAQLPTPNANSDPLKKKNAR